MAGGRKSKPTQKQMAKTAFVADLVRFQDRTLAEAPEKLKPVQEQATRRKVCTTCNNKYVGDSCPKCKKRTRTRSGRN